MPIELDTLHNEGAKIRVIGVGGGGGNAINNMIRKGLDGVDFIVANTDRQALAHNLAPIKIQVGKETTRGLGAGANPEVGKKSVEETFDEIKEFLKSSDMIFVACGMGGGTGTGGAPIIARIGQELGALVVGIVTKPFHWEGNKRMNLASEGIKELSQYVDALICIPNQKLLDIIDKNTSFGEAFEKVDEVLYNATKGIADIISKHGMVNVDFADVRTVMKGMGEALMGIGTASGDNRAAEATHNALNSPLLEGTSIAGAQGVLVNITGGRDISMLEVAEVVSIVENAAGKDVNLIHGIVYGDEPSDEIMVTVVATGMNSAKEERAKSAYEDFSHLKVKQPINLPFVKGENKNEYSNTSRLFGNQTTFPSVEATVSAGNGNGNGNGKIFTNRTSQTPRNASELKSIDDIPAYERRKQKDGFHAFNPAFSINRDEQEYSETSETADEKPDILEKPAFLRKIMD